MSVRSSILSLRDRLPDVHVEEFGGSHPLARRLEWQPVIVQASLMWLGSRLAFAVFTYFAVLFNGQASGPHAKLNLSRFLPDALASHWNQWDVGWYTQIAISGYNSHQTTAFLPLFPFLIHVVTLVVGTSHVLFSAMLVSNLGMLAAFIGLALLTTNEGEESGNFTIKAAAAYPFAFFTVTGYSDGVFLAACTFSLLFARRGNWIACGISTALATLTRPVAVVLILPILWEVLRQHGVTPSTIRRRFSVGIVRDAVIALAPIPVIFAGWAVYMNSKFHDPLIFFKAQDKFWDHKTVAPWTTVQTMYTILHDSPSWTFVQARIFVDVLPIIIFALLTVVSIRRIPFSFTLYMLGVYAILMTAIVPADYDPFNAEGRYLLMSAPLFFLLGRWMSRRPGLEMFIVSGGFLLQGVLAAFFLRGGWIV